MNREINMSNNKKKDNNKIEDLNIDKEKIIINSYNDKNDENENNENLNPFKYYKNNKKNIYLYIPESFVDGQIINREVNVSKNKNDEIKKLKNNDINDINDNNYIKRNDKKDIDKNINEKVQEYYTFIGNINEKDENEKYNPSYKIHPPNLRQYLYVPTSILEDQIIKRVLILNKNENINSNMEDNPEKNENGNKSINLDEKEKNDDKKEIIINYENTFEQNNNYNKIKPNKNILFIPYSSIDDRIIFREIETNEKIIKNKKRLINLDNSKEKKRIEYNGPDNLKNNVYPEDEFLDNSRIIYLETKNNDEIKIKKYSNGLKIYIPEYIIEDRIINREIISNNK